MEYGELVYACAISRIFNYDCAVAKVLTDNYPSPESVFSLSRGELCDIFCPKSKYVGEILDHSHLEASAAEVEWALSHNIRIYYIGDADYPVRLKECNDAPTVLFYRGTADLNKKRIVSIVGTRKATPYGRDMCDLIVKSFAGLDNPPSIVSGLAFGIDICAHRAAMEYGLDTVGVMATGLDSIYPPQHRNDAVRMAGMGGLATDFPKGTVPLPVNFIRRNRIIAGLCDAVILVESGREGGGVITSKMAYSYSREVFAVPGKMTDTFSEGCNCLIKDNIANPIISPDTVSKLMGWKKRKNSREKKANVLIFESDNEIKKRILKVLSDYVPKDIDSIMDATGEDMQDIILSLTELEIEGRVVSDVSGKISLA